MSILACVLLADWQSIPYDKCTEFSVYKDTKLLTGNPYMDTESPMQIGVQLEEHSIYYSTSNERIKCNIIPNTTHNFFVGEFQECCFIQYSSDSTRLHINKYPCDSIGDETYMMMFTCHLNQSTPLCTSFNETVLNDTQISPFINDEFTLTRDQYQDAMTRCIQGGDQCHWNPNSRITKHHCSNCPPICRSLSRSLNFLQFCFGACLLMISIPIAWVPVASMASEWTSKEMQVRVHTCHRIISMVLFS